MRGEGIEMKEYEEGLRLLPEHMRQGVTLYIERGLPYMGDFLRAVMENNLTEAFGRADYINEAHMKDWVNFIYNYAPSQCHGSREKVKAWVERGGLVGREDVLAGAGIK
jgi:hypothetical protein